MECKTASVGYKCKNKKEDVEEVQQYLKALKLYIRQIDGIPGPYTIAAIKKLQAKQGNSQDGVFGPKTCNKSDIGKSSVKKGETAGKNIKILGSSWKEQPTITTCGPASISIAFTRYNINAPIMALAKLMNTGSSGTHPKDLVNGVSKFNENFVLLEYDLSSFEQICRFIDLGYPVILQLQTQDPVDYGKTKSCMDYYNSYGHYVEIDGYDKNNKLLLLKDPSRNSRWEKYTCLKKAILWRLSLGKIKPVKVLKKK